MWRRLAGRRQEEFQVEGPERGSLWGLSSDIELAEPLLERSGAGCGGSQSRGPFSFLFFCFVLRYVLTVSQPGCPETHRVVPDGLKHTIPGVSQVLELQTFTTRLGFKLWNFLGKRDRFSLCSSDWP